MRRVSVGHSSVAMLSNINGSLDEAVRAIHQEAQSGFTTMNETADFLRTGQSNGRIKVYQSVSGIDPATRMRTVTLRAEWMERGMLKTKQLNFTVAPVMTGTAGAASLRVRVVQQGTNIGLEGVK